MTEHGPEMQGAIDDVWLEKAREAMRVRITTNLQLISDGYYSEEELAFALAIDALPHIDVEEEELAEILDSQDYEAYNRYAALHPELQAHAAILLRLANVREAALDRKEFKAHEDLPHEDAVEAVIASRADEIKTDAFLEQAIMQAAAKHGFAI